MAPVDPPGSQPIAAPIAAVINGPIVFTSTLSGEAPVISSPNRADTPADRRIHNHALRGACNGLANVSRVRRFRDYARLRIITFYTRVRICSRLFLTIYDISCTITFNHQFNLRRGAVFVAERECGRIQR